MCTVTFTPKPNDSFILTSNRDEAPQRHTIPPKVYTMEGIRVLFPRDQLAGGTWIGASEKKRLVCLLNGGFEPHKRRESYRMSRGIIVTELLKDEDASKAIRQFDFSNIEPFTIILVDWKSSLRLYEFVWDGQASHFDEKSLAPHIWSSSLLYTSEVKRKRESWFSEFLMDTVSPSEEELLNFHRVAGEGDPGSDLVMDRGFVKTKSISQISKKDEDICFLYEDLQSQNITTASL
jgi:hypothetical protein